MPIEIREVVVRVAVDSNSQQPPSGSEDSARRRDEVVQECVDQVLEILRERKEP